MLPQLSSVHLNLFMPSIQNLLSTTIIILRLHIAYFPPAVPKLRCMKL